MKEYINPMLRIFSILGLVGVAFIQQSEIRRYKSVEQQLFILQTEVGKYEMAAELLKEEDSIAGQKLELILLTKTE
jgi:hypothetical protein